MNKWLIGNGHWCPSCGGTGRGRHTSRIEYEGGGYADLYDPCATCGGQRRLAGPGPSTPRPRPSCLVDVIEYGRTG